MDERGFSRRTWMVIVVVWAAAMCLGSTTFMGGGSDDVESFGELSASTVSAAASVLEPVSESPRIRTLEEEAARIAAIRAHNRRVSESLNPVAAEENAPVELGNASLLALVEMANTPERRAIRLRMIGRNGAPGAQPILERYAELGAGTVEGYTAQMVLLQRYPTSWPAQAATDYEYLVQREGIYRWMLPFASGGYGKSRYGWGDSAFDPRHSGFQAPAASQEIEAFMDNYPDFMSADDAMWHLARAYQFEGRPAVEVIDTLDRAFSYPDGDAQRLIWASLRHYLVERATDAELDSWLWNTTWTPQTQYAVRYARGVRYLWDLNLQRALDMFRQLGDPPLRLYWSAQPISDRIAIIEGLMPAYDAWRQARGSSREALLFVAFVDQFMATPRSWRFFEPWLIIDNDRHHYIVQYLGPEAQRLERRFRRANEHDEIVRVMQAAGIHVENQ